MTRTGLSRCAAIALALAGLATMASAAEATSGPPKNLKLVGDHWTPWDPPPAGPDAYIIQKGDTLWDLAQKWLGDPYLWPQIWDQNRYILDSHWIYPGDPLVVPPRPTVVPEQGPPAGQETPPTAKTPVLEIKPAPEPAPTPPPRPRVEVPAAEPEVLLPLASAADVYCSGRIDPRHQASTLRVLGGDSEKIARAEGDVVYLNRGRDHGLRVGEQFAVERERHEVLHPTNGERLGTYIQRLGRVRVLIAHERTSTAVIDVACAEIVAGDELAPWVEIPIPHGRRSRPFDRYSGEASGGPEGQIVAYGPESAALIGEGSVVHTDLGQGSGVRPGDVLTLFRPQSGLPRLALGQAVVLTVEPVTSTVKVLRSTRELWVGDRVEVASR